jgi:putative transposase
LFPSVRLALVRAARRDPERFRIVHFSVQRDHVHLLVEATDKRALSSGIRSVMIRIARYVNDLLNRRGPLWADRWHGHALRSPREVRNAIVYVLANLRKHEIFANKLEVDPCSSATWFDGWARSGLSPPDATLEPPIAQQRSVLTSISHGEDRRTFAPRTWLLRVGWRRHGLIGMTEKPANGRAR